LFRVLFEYVKENVDEQPFLKPRKFRAVGAETAESGKFKLNLSRKTQSNVTFGFRLFKLLKRELQFEFLK